MPPHPDLAHAAALLAEGRPRQALELARAYPAGAALAAAAALRLGDLASAVTLLDTTPHGARRAVLLARATFLAADTASMATVLPQAEQARALARAEGDAPALVAAVTLLGEAQLLAKLPDRFLPLRTLAEGLKVAELTGERADAHLLAVLAAAQTASSSHKAAQTATKALERAQPGSPAQVGALMLLGDTVKAHNQQRAGEIDGRWLRAFDGAQ